MLMKFLIISLKRRVSTIPKDKESKNPNYETWKKQRSDWGDISPVTKIIPNKKKNRKEKHKGKQYDDD